MALLTPNLSLKLLVVGLFAALAGAFAPGGNSGRTVVSSTKMPMIGGRGWDNNDYLGALSGDDEERKKSTDDYQDYSERRKAFGERQEELMKSPQARAFLEQRQNSMPRNDPDYDGFDDIFADSQPGSGGGSRMADMMARAKRKQQGMGGMGGMGGPVEQKLFKLDDDDEDQQEN
jgi:hypothetical protein